MFEKCDGTIEAGRSGGELISQVSLEYGNNVTCTVTITADAGRQILLTFGQVDIKGGLGCEEDYLKVYDGPSAALSPDLGVICGSSASNIVSTSAAVTLRFKTDGSSVGQGFSLVYTSFSSSYVCKFNEIEADISARTF